MDPDPPTPPHDPPPPRRRGLWAVAWLALLTVPLLPLCGAAWVLLLADLPDYALDGDGALIELRVREALAGRQLLGSYSRLGFDHPGPLHFYLTAPFLAAADGRTAGLNLAAVAWNLVALLTTLAVAARAGGVALAAAGAVACAGYVAFLGQVTITIWDPALVILPTLACVVAAAAVATGRWWPLVPAVLAGSFAAQAQLSVVPAIAAALATGTALGWLGGRRRAPRRRAGPAVLTAVAAGAASVAPTVYEQLTRTPGNLTRIVAGLQLEGPRPGFGDALGLAAERATAFVRDLLGVGVGAVGFAAALQLAVLAAAAWTAHRRGQRGIAALGALALVLHAVAPVAVGRIVGPLRPHMLQWIVTLGPLAVWVVGAAVLARASRAHWGARIAAGLATALLLGWATVRGGERLLAETLVFVAEPATAARTPGLGPALDRLARVLDEHGATSVALRVAGARAEPLDEAAFTTAAGVVLGLQRRGIATAPDPAHAFAYPERMPRPTDADAEVVLYDATTRAAVAPLGPLWDDCDLGAWGFAVLPR